MCWWDKQLIDKITGNNMILELYKRYVDDSNMVIDDRRADTTDESVVKYISKIADSIDQCIRTTYDYCSNYKDGKLPMLDTKLWIGKSINDEWKILHTHYMKDVSSRFLIHARSAHPSNMKLNVLVNEGLRVLRNCSIHLGWEEGKRHLQYFVQRMQYSEVKKACKRNKLRIKVVEKMRKTIKKELQRSNPFKNKNCAREDCVLC